MLSKMWKGKKVNPSPTPKERQALAQEQLVRELATAQAAVDEITAALKVAANDINTHQQQLLLLLERVTNAVENLAKR